MMAWIQYVWALLRLSCGRFWREHFSFRASALAFSSLLAMVPCFTVVLSVLNRLPIQQRLLDALQNSIADTFIPSQGHKVVQALNHFALQAQQLPWFSFLFLIVVALYLLRAIENHFNVIWQVPKGRDWLKALCVYILILFIAPSLMTLSVVASTYLFSLKVLDLYLHGAWHWLKWIPFGGSFLAFFVLYVGMPHTKVRWSCAAIGAVLAALLFEGMKSLFTLYLQLFPSYALLYGALAIVPIFLVWLSIAWMITFLGALLSASLEQVSLQTACQEPVDPFSHALLWLALLAQHPKGLSLFELSRAIPLSMSAREMLAILIQRGWLCVHKKRYSLSAGTSSLTLFTIYQQLPFALPRTGARFFAHHGRGAACALFERIEQQIAHDLDVRLADLLSQDAR
jgi:membrane protein